MLKKRYTIAAIATAIIGVAVGAVQFAAEPANAQASGPLTAQCRFKDARSAVVTYFGAGETVLFVPRGDALMRDRGGPQTRYHPEYRNRIASAELKPGCRAVLYGQFGANWGHRVVTQTASVAACLISWLF